MHRETGSASDTIVLCTDLDRTLIPNGLQPESPSARQVFTQLVQRPEIVLVYVTGRDQSLVRDSINEYQLPQPNYVVSDVGTNIYRVKDSQWELIADWHRKISPDWRGYHWRQLADMVGKIAGVELQQERKQNEFKLSYQSSPAKKLLDVLPLLDSKLRTLDINFACIHSVDETLDQGLIDILPGSAGKRAAIDFLADYLGVTQQALFFSGDSGNDFDVLISPYCSTLVANATDEVKSSAIDQCKAMGVSESLYISQGLSTELNGNYAAGIVEGFLHFFPQAKMWLDLS